MRCSMNRVELIGGLTRDPDVTVMQSGVVSWYASIAVNGTRYDKDAGQQIVHTTYVSLSAIGWMAEALVEADYFKGDELWVVGELDQFEIERDGKKDRKTRVRPLVVAPVRRAARQPQAPSF